MSVTFVDREGNVIPGPNPARRRAQGLVAILICAGLFVVVARINFVASAAYVPWRNTLSCGGAALLSMLFWKPFAARVDGQSDMGSIRKTFTLVTFPFIIAGFLWVFVFSALGDLHARLWGEPQRMTAVLEKKDSSRKGWSCRTRLEGDAIGVSECVTQQLFDRLPLYVSVTLFVRRSALGYRVDRVVVHEAEADG